jgi:broad specificity phosphatase PhoE
VDANLREVDFGEAEGATFGELEQRWPGIARSLAAEEMCIDWPGGESSHLLRARVEDAWRRLTSTSYEDQLLVTHGVPARLILELAVGDLQRSAPRSLAPGQFVLLSGDQTWGIAEVWRQ